MTDNELSNLLQEWKRSPAPRTLTERVFGSHRTPAPGWWDRIPALQAVALGISVATLVVFGLMSLVPSSSTTPVAEPIVQIPPPVPPSEEKITGLELTAPKPRPESLPKATRTSAVAKPKAPEVAILEPALISAPPPAYP
ncbi:MAG: hypothetical protein ABI995_14590, partial [Acidobacteriota bacterium]